MPLFFFNVHDGFDILDEVGTELPGWREAQEEAIWVAGRIISDSSKRLKLGEDWWMDVADETGLVLFRLDFSIMGSAAIIGSSPPSLACQPGGDPP